MTPLESFDHQQLNAPNVPSSNRSIAQRLRRERERALARQSPNPKQKRSHVDPTTGLPGSSSVQPVNDTAQGLMATLSLGTDSSHSSASSSDSPKAAHLPRHIRIAPAPPSVSYPDTKSEAQLAVRSKMIPLLPSRRSMAQQARQTRKRAEEMRHQSSPSQDQNGPSSSREQARNPHANPSTSPSTHKKKELFVN
ncbi:hypothetical protein ARMSODRAFT_952364 [Armillaria solidipes]|uniref:Uncharacterized protein n=1 Tax=Armillaria solidipes TaxID=1076256 RepID=A0A2H3CB07_9AGAR|nr:hypothetical protein ARMSODRAFT_952364 [Armillaria solidipes]